MESLGFLLKNEKMKLKNNGSNSPATYALCRVNINNRKKMLKLLIQYGLNTKSRKNDGQNLLDHFISNDLEESDDEAVEIAEILLNSGISVNDLCQCNNSALSAKLLINNILH